MSLLPFVVLLSALTPHQSHLNTILARAAALGDTAKVEAELRAGADINMETLLGQRPLELAAEYRHLGTVRLLLNHGAWVNSASGFGTPLSWAVLGQNIAITRLLLIRGAWPDYGGQTSSPLTLALLCSDDPQRQSSNVSSTFIEILPHTAHNRRLARLLEKKYEEQEVQFMGVSPKSPKERHTAGLQVVSLLLEYGADANRKSDTGSTPLMSASLAGNADSARMLIDHGAVVDAKNNSGLTALWNATLSGSMELVKLLVGKGAAVDAQGDNGSYPLLNAVAGRKAEMVQFLLEHGANPNLPAKSAETALGIAKMYQDAKIIALLQAAGAK